MCPALKKTAAPYFLFISTLALLLSCSPNEKYIGGVQVNEPDYQIWSDALKRNHMNTVSVTVYAKQGDWNSDNFWHDGLEEGVLNEIRIAKKNNLKVALILRTALDHAYEKNKFLWHGMILPKDKKTTSNWFDKYEDYVLFWAKIAEQEGVDILGIGSELRALSATKILSKADFLTEYSDFISWQEKSEDLVLKHGDEIKEQHLWVRGYDNFNSLVDFMSQKTKAKKQWAEMVYDTSNTNAYPNYIKRTNYIESRWKSLIAKTKQTYHKKITYAANFDNYQNVSFWDQLDFIGINAYFKLRNNITEELKERKLEQLVTKSWDSTFNSFTIFKDTNHFNAPILFTELGYTYRKNSTIEPWSHDEFSVVEWKDTSKLMVWYEQPKSYTERNIAINSLIKVNKKYDELLKGILYWKLSTNHSHEQYEEFLLHIGKNSKDPLLKTLSKF